ncbi:hypothetical protein OZX74_06410 [Bifidobacterium sp. ESL0798]|uniref:hypothetical protein n=1 Tax=Bifidobacterium sp. ESL0798 TaxID=2983235 RepID=UPI0023F94C10|nr:hypothetical protein [Bifidobacterium sp. ESL0798]WEV73552.1 hypothetical protein OZX74_06410 [Bifidobacterium sp. ESL0798]
MAGRRVASASSGKNGSTRRGRSAASSSRFSSMSDDEPMVNDFGVRTGRRGKTGHSDFRMGENSQNKSHSPRNRTKEDSPRLARSVASGTPVGDDTTVDARRAKLRAGASKTALRGGKPTQSAAAQPSRNKKTVGFFHRRQSGRPKYGIDEPLTDTDDTSQPARSPRSASSAGAVTKSAPGGFVDARALKNEDLIGETLNQTSGALGVAARPKVIDFNARLKERRRVHVFKTAAKVLIALVVRGCFGVARLAALLLAGLFA